MVFNCVHSVNNIEIFNVRVTFSPDACNINSICVTTHIKLVFFKEYFSFWNVVQFYSSGVIHVCGMGQCQDTEVICGG
jgi:hypothetical protein